MKSYSVALLSITSLALVGQSAFAAIVFDNFNVDEGHFNLAPSFSGTTVGEDPSSTADRVTTDSIEGEGSQLLHLVHDASFDPFRLRHLSGGGTPANNIPFTISEGIDGFIGFYIKTTAIGWQVSINLDGPAGSIADMDGSTSISIIGDGEWHLYEWDLDSFTDWNAVPGIGGGHGGSLPFGTHTIDSIYFRDLDFEPGPTADFFLDFVAKSDEGSIAELIPEPSIAMAALVGGVVLLGRSRRRRF
jgi:hypothetical protein